MRGRKGCNEGEMGVREGGEEGHEDRWRQKSWRAVKMD